MELTDDEEETFLDVLRDVEHWGVETGTWEQGKVIAAVEAILTAHDAAIRAETLREVRSAIDALPSDPLGTHIVVRARDIYDALAALRAALTPEATP